MKKKNKEWPPKPFVCKPCEAAVILGKFLQDYMSRGE